MNSANKIACKHCDTDKPPYLSGASSSGVKRYVCRDCGRSFQVRYKLAIFEEGTKEKAIELFYAGVPGNEIADTLHISLHALAKILKPHKGKRTGLICPGCGGDEISRFGYDRGKQRYRCKLCKKTFINR